MQVASNNTGGHLPSFQLQYFLLIFAPLDGGIAEHVEELTPQLQVSGCVWEGFSPDLPDDLWGW